MAGRTKKKGNKICPAGIAWAKRTFDKYPSAYANMAASKYCKDPNYGKKNKVDYNGIGFKNKDVDKFGMLSVKAGIDNNPKVTYADKIAGAKMKK